MHGILLSAAAAFLVVGLVVAIYILGRVLARHRFSRAFNRGKELERQNRHRESYDAFLAAFQLAPAGNGIKRQQTALRLTLAAHNTGWQEQSLEWARKTLDLDPSLLNKIMAHGSAGRSLISLNRLDEAEAHLKSQRDIALRAGQQDYASTALSHLASIQRKRGNVNRAIELAQKSTEEAPQDNFLTFVFLSVCLRTAGRYEEAHHAILEARTRQREWLSKRPLQKTSYDYHSRRQQATLALALAGIEARLGRLDDAWCSLEEAQSAFENDERLRIRCEATAAWLLALRGCTGEAVQKIDQVEAAVAQTGNQAQPASWGASYQASTDQDRDILSAVYSLLGQAATAAHQFDRCRSFWERFMTLPLAPVDKPTGYYHLADCCENLGDLPAARDFYRRSVETGIASHYAKLAAERLNDLNRPAG